MQKSKKLLVSVLALLALVVACVFMNTEKKTTTIGEVQIELVDINGDIFDSREIAYEVDDTLVSLLESNYDNVTFDNGMIMTIDKLDTKEDWSEFISIYVNDEMSMVGAYDIVLEDNLKVSFIQTAFIYE